jgi:O-antigen/teichoic acid export membrane protein
MRGATLVATVLVANSLGPTQFGEFGMIQSTIGLFAVFAGGALSLTATWYVARRSESDRDERGRNAVDLLVWALVAGVPSAAILGALAPWLAGEALGQPDLLPVLRLAAMLVVLVPLNGVYAGLIAGLQEFRTMAAVQASRGLLLLPLLVAGAQQWGVAGAVLGLVFAEGLGVVVGHVALLRTCGRCMIPLRLAVPGWRRVLSLSAFALPALLSSLAVQPALWSTRVMLINQPDGYQSMGLYLAADRWQQVLIFVPSAVAPSLLAMLTSLSGTHNASAYKRLFSVNLVLNMLLVLPAAGLLAILAPHAMAVFGESYERGWVTLVFLSLCSITVVLNTALGQVLVSEGRIWWRFAFDLLLAGLIVGLAWWLVPTLREAGLAVSHLLAYGLTAAGLVLAATRVMAGSAVTRHLPSAGHSSAPI